MGKSFVKDDEAGKLNVGRKSLEWGFITNYYGDMMRCGKQ
jgi:hypothetical protein